MALRGGVRNRSLLFDMTKKSKAFFPVIIIGLVVVGIIVIYSFFDPAKYVWMPKCPFHLLTGWNCPACGLQRALHALLHGHFSQALSYNYFFIISIPYAVALIISEVLKSLHSGGRFVSIVEHPLLARLYIVLFFIWWIVRNVLGI